MTLRQPETQAAYDDFKKQGGLDGECVLCAGPALKTFTHWKIMENKFPYTRIASTHHMVVSLRHASEHEITQEEWEEWNAIKNSPDVQANYDFIMEATHKTKTVPAHMHVHLVVINV